jgi:hypothetical protein
MKATAQVDLGILPLDIGITFPYRTEGAKGAVVVGDQANRPDLSDATPVKQVVR